MVVNLSRARCIVVNKSNECFAQFSLRMDLTNNFAEENRISDSYITYRRWPTMAL